MHYDIKNKLIHLSYATYTEWRQIISLIFLGYPIVFKLVFR